MHNDGDRSRIQLKNGRETLVARRSCCFFKLNSNVFFQLWNFSISHSNHTATKYRIVSIWKKDANQKPLLELIKCVDTVIGQFDMEHLVYNSPIIIRQRCNFKSAAIHSIDLSNFFWSDGSWFIWTFIQKFTAVIQFSEFMLFLDFARIYSFVGQS